MPSRFKNVFHKNNKIIIGALHLPPLLGYPEFPGLEIAEKNALADLEAFVAGGVDSVIFENNYDIPHKARISPTTARCMTFLGQKIKNQAKTSVGVSVLWNDYRTALTMAKELNLKFIRIPVFVDTVKTSYGIMRPCAKDAVAFRKRIGAERVALFTDIHVKHSKLVSKYNIVESASRAVKAGSDALVLTGQWTGDAPDINELIAVRRKFKTFPIVLGSGVDKNNVKELFKYANAAIVSTSLKSGKVSNKLTNLKDYKQRIDARLVRQLKLAL